MRILIPKKTKLLVSRRSPGCSDCLLRFYGADKKNLKINCNKIKINFFFLKFDFLNENHHPTRHLKYKKIDLAPCNNSILANKLLSTNLERF